MKNLFILIFCFTLSSLGLAQKSSNNPCYGDLNNDPIVETIEHIRYIFTGSDTTGLNVTMKKITIFEARQEIVKKRKGIDCISQNSEDCMVEVLEEIPAVTMNMYTLPNADVSKEYDIRKVYEDVVTKPGGQSKEGIVCIKNRSSALIKKIQNALISKGYPLNVNGLLDQATNIAINDFQKSNKMAYGDLTLATLSALDIK